MTISMNVKSELFTEDKTSTPLFSTVPITTGATSEWRSIFMLEAKNVKAGERFEIHGDGQVTIPDAITYNIDPTAIIEVRTAHTDGTEAIQNGSSISIWHSSVNAPEGGNISLSRDHHHGFDETFDFTAPADYASLYITLRFRARSTAAQSGHVVDVDNGQGQLKYKRFR